MVNVSIAYARLSEDRKANDALQKALRVVPENAAANFNMGLLKAEQNDLKQAETYLRTALKSDPQMVQAAYNLCVITAADRLEEAIGFCRQANGLRPDDPRYAYTLAYYLNLRGDSDEAMSILKRLLEKFPASREAQLLLQTMSRANEARP